MFASKEKILVLGTIPTIKNEKDGMIQRELAIDSLIKHKKRVYVDNVDERFTFWRYPRTYFRSFFGDKKWVLKDRNVRNYSKITVKNLYKLAKEAKFIYVHSLFKLVNLPLEMIEEFKEKIILDIHGCVVEEQIFCDVDETYINLFKQYEEFAFPKINTLIAVSENMVDFYKNKYPNIKTNFILLPIFNRIENISRTKSSHALNIIYSGGSQKWQKVDLMLDFINKVIDTNVYITILTPDVSVFIQGINDFEHKNNIEIKTLDSTQLAEEYLKADIGIIFRDNFVVNQVACPTKMIDYLSYGIVPCVLQPEIGDFNRLGYRYFTINDIISDNRLKIINDLKSFREQNYTV